MRETCQECVHFENGMCKLKPGACLNYDHFQWYPMIMISPSDLENKYVSRISYDSLLKRAKAAEAKVAELEAATRWIPVTERIPEEEVTVICSHERTTSVETACYADGYWWQYGQKVIITHWMPLPNPPQEEK